MHGMKASRSLTKLPASSALAAAVERRILLVRGQKVMLDSDLAELYGAPTRHLNQQVRRSRKRFPADFMSQLTRYAPLVFTEQGVAMLSSVLHSERAIQVNIAIMRAFVRLREIIASHQDLATRLDALEKKYDSRFKVVFDAIRELTAPPQPRRRPIGFAPLTSSSSAQASAGAGSGRSS